MPPTGHASTHLRESGRDLPGKYACRIVSTDVPIIDRHGDFYAAYFLGFLRELYDDLLLR
jgi:hypothetical protein